MMAGAAMLPPSLISACAAAKMLERGFFARNSFRKRIASSLIWLLGNRWRRSSSRLQISSEATSDREGRSKEANSLGVFVSDEPPFGA